MWSLVTRAALADTLPMQLGISIRYLSSYEVFFQCELQDALW